MMNEICSDCHQKSKFCHDSLFGPYALACVTYHLQFLPVELMGNHEEAKKIFRKAYNHVLKFNSFCMNNNYHLPEVNYHLPRCVKHTIECFADSLSDHEDWILRGMDTLDSPHPIGLSWKGEQFSSAKSKFADCNHKT